MEPIVIFGIQSTLSLIIFGLIGWWFVAPRLNSLALQEALLPLALVHTFRYAPLTLFLPEVLNTGIPKSVISTVAIGDLTCAIIALIAVILLKGQMKGAINFVWLLNVVGIVDVIIAMTFGITAKLYTYPLGFGWYILNFYVPLVIVTHAMMVNRLVKGK